MRIGIHPGPDSVRVLVVYLCFTMKQNYQYSTPVLMRLHSWVESSIQQVHDVVVGSTVLPAPPSRRKTCQLTTFLHGAKLNLYCKYVETIHVILCIYTRDNYTII